MNAEPTSGLVLINGRVQTLEPSSRMAEAVAIFGGRIVEVGSTEEVRAALPGAPTVDLEGGTVSPRFHRQSHALQAGVGLPVPVH